MVSEAAKIPQITLIFRNVPTDTLQKILSVINEKQLSVACELTRNSTNFDQLSSFVTEFPNVMIGAGTITNHTEAREAVRAGAQFILSPTLLDHEVIRYCHENGVLAVPGAFSPSEIAKAKASGADAIKLFPATALKPSYLNQLAGPLGAIPLMAVGGINRENAKDWLAAGATHVGIGSAIFSEIGTSPNKYQIEQVLTSLVEYSR